jgi:hypothetical protein
MITAKAAHRGQRRRGRSPQIPVSTLWVALPEMNRQEVVWTLIMLVERVAAGAGGLAGGGGEGDAARARGGKDFGAAS